MKPSSLARPFARQTTLKYFLQRAAPRPGVPTPADEPPAATPAAAPPPAAPTPADEPPAASPVLDAEAAEALQWAEANLEDEEEPGQQPGGRRGQPGGRKTNAERGLDLRGTAGGWGSNRLYAGMQRRRHDWSAHEAVELCEFVEALRAGGADRAEVNRALLRRMSGNTKSGAKGAKLRSIKEMLAKGIDFWRARLKTLQVGKHSSRKKGGVLKKVCKTSEARGCRAPGGGRKDRFCSYKAAVKRVFHLELENGQEVFHSVPLASQ